ncbi:TPA: DUF4165 domain-containing protein [Salmonella enterica subsp. enterica serovar Kottbus]|nr:DUF4165 domain-containing protein [Salmonella enterica subsp. enterica serovar Kottbus]
MGASYMPVTHCVVTVILPALGEGKFVVQINVLDLNQKPVATYNYNPYNAPTYQPLGRWDGIFHYIPPSF